MDNRYGINIVGRCARGRVWPVWDIVWAMPTKFHSCLSLLFNWKPDEFVMLKLYHDLINLPSRALPYLLPFLKVPGMKSARFGSYRSLPVTFSLYLYAFLYP
jgi:hypothetical protein